MARNYATLAFTPAIQQLQTQYGSRSAYARMALQTYYDGLTPSEQAFISERDSFYIASIGANGFPYIQHRGGPKGFLHVLDDFTLGFLDYRGNQQFISIGNIAENPQVALILVDYPHRTRLKLYARAEVLALAEHPELVAQLAPPAGYKARPERLIRLHVEAYDWNCPQHITPRFTAEELAEVLSPQQTYITDLEAEVRQLRAALADAPPGDTAPTA